MIYKKTDILSSAGILLFYISNLSKTELFVALSFTSPINLTLRCLLCNEFFIAKLFLRNSNKNKNDRKSSITILYNFFLIKVTSFDCSNDRIKSNRGYVEIEQRFYNTG